MTKADFFAAHRDEVKKVHKTAKDCRQELIRLWNEHLKKIQTSEKKEGGKKIADANATNATSPKPMYHKFDEAISDEQAIEWNLKKIGVMGEKHVYVEDSQLESVTKPLAKKQKTDKDIPTPSSVSNSEARADLEKAQMSHADERGKVHAAMELLKQVESSQKRTATSLAINQITSWLMKLDQNTLKLIAAKIGKPTSGTKKYLVEHILNDMKAARISDKLLAQKKSESSALEGSASAAIDVDDDDDDAAAEEDDDAESDEEDSEEEEEEDDEDDSEEEDEEEDEDDDN